MRTIRHIFKKDSLQQRGGIIFIILLLFIRLLSDLQPIQDEGLGSALFGSVALYLLMGAIAVLVPAVMADPLGNHQAFYRTRPIRTQDIVGAKLLFLLVWIVSPIVLTETIYLSFHSLPIGFILQASTEKVFFIILFGLVIGAAATTHPNIKTAIMTLLAAIPVPFVGAMFWERISELFAISSLSPAKMSPTGWLLLGSFAFLVFAAFAYHAAKHPMRRIIRSIPMILVGFGIPLFATSWQSALSSERPNQPGTKSEPKADIPRSNLTVTAYDHGTDPEKIQVQVTAQPSYPRRAGKVVEWTVSEMRLNEDQSRTRSGTFRSPSSQIFYRRTNSSRRGHEIEAIAHLLPKQIRLFHGSTGSGYFQSRASGTMSANRSAQLIDRSTSLTGRLRGREFTWKLVGELPIEKNKTLDSGETSWRFLSLRQHEDDAFAIHLAWHRPALSLSRRQDWKTQGTDVLSRHEFLVIQEADAIGFTPESSYQKPGTGLLTAFKKNHVTLQFRHTRSHDLKIPRFIPSRAKILVFEKSYEQEIKLSWEIPNLQLANHFQDRTNNNLKPAQRLSRHEFVARLDALGAVPLRQSRAEAGRYLFAVVKLVQDRDEWIRPDDPLALKLAPLAQEHPQMFLDGLRNAHYRAAQLLESCLQQGLSEDQKSIVIERLTKQPKLANLAVTRGWFEAARKQFQQIAQEHSNLPLSAVRALILLEETSVYPQLLADFKHNPSLPYYDALRTLPELEDDLDRAVQGLWDRRPRVLSHQLNQRELYGIALRHGIQGAIIEICQIVSWLPSDNYSQAYGITRAIQGNVDLSDLPQHERNNTPQVLNWLSRQDPSSFKYDPGRRIFYSKKA